MNARDHEAGPLRTSTRSDRILKHLICECSYMRANSTSIKRRSSTRSQRPSSIRGVVGDQMARRPTGLGLQMPAKKRRVKTGLSVELILQRSRVARSVVVTLRRTRATAPASARVRIRHSPHAFPRGVAFSETTLQAPSTSSFPGSGLQNAQPPRPPLGKLLAPVALSSVPESCCWNGCAETDATWCRVAKGASFRSV